jgi:hypothetical protein
MIVLQKWKKKEIKRINQWKDNQNSDLIISLLKLLILIKVCMVKIEKLKK